MLEEDFAKEMAKQLPVKEAYSDAVSPAAKQVGELGEDLVKVLRLVLFPVQHLAALQDRYRNFLKTSVARVPSDKQITPPPQILGPVLEGVRYEPEGTEIDEMFSQLLSTSMDKDRVEHAHPAFPQIIKQISADEAKLLKALSTTTKPFRLVNTFKLANGLSYSDKIEIDELPTEGLVFPENIAFYREHFEKLGLLIYDAEKPMQPIMNGNQQTGGRNFYNYRLTGLGRKFMMACNP